MRRRGYHRPCIILFCLLLVACSTTPTATPIPTPTIDIAPTQTRIAELALINSLRATIAAPTTTPIPPTATMSPTVTITAVPPTATGISTRTQAVVGNAMAFRDSRGELVVCGEIYNSGSLAATNFSITVELLGGSGQVIASGQANAVGLNILELGEKTVWSAPIPNGPTTWSEARFRVQSGPVTSSVRNFTADGLTVEGVTISPPASQFGNPSIAGQIRNSGKTPARAIQIVVGSYDAIGKLLVVTLDVTQVREIAPGETAPFSMLLEDKKTPPKVVVYTKGVR